jgi:hypothetical protein
LAPETLLTANPLAVRLDLWLSNRSVPDVGS